LVVYGGAVHSFTNPAAGDDKSIANTITLQAWRNGPIENVHAGRYVGYGLNERRVLPKAEKSIIRHAQNGLFSGLKTADYLRYDGIGRG
jgi:hypothetical protein